MSGPNGTVAYGIRSYVHDAAPSSARGSRGHPKCLDAFGLVLGGDDPGLTTSSGYVVDINGSEAAHGHWLNGAHSYHIEIETIHDHGGDVESITPKRHRITEQYIGTYDDRLIVVKDQAITPPPPSTRSLSEILADYRASQTQLARLQAELAETTDPVHQQFLQDAINAETAHLAGVTAEALAAGATQAELDQIVNEAQQAAENDPIDPDDGDGGDSVLWAAIWGWKEGEVQGTLNSINGVQDILIGMGNFGSQTSPAGIIGSLFGFDPITFASPDWSNGAIYASRRIHHRRSDSA